MPQAASHKPQTASLKQQNSSAGQLPSLLFILFIAFAFGLIWTILINSYPFSDGKWYDDKAWNIVNGLGYSVDGKPTAYWPVGYSLFLSVIYNIFGHSLFLAKIANILMYLGIIILSYLISKIMFNSIKIAKVTALLLAIWPNQIAFTSLTLSEVYFSFLFLFASFMLLKNLKDIKNIIISGILFGFSCLAKPVSILFPLFSVAFLNKGQNKTALKNILVIYFVIFSVLLPWIIRNYKVFGHFVFVSTNGGINLYIGNNKLATGFYVWDEEVRRPIEAVSGEYEKDRLANKLALEHINSHPFKTITLSFKKLFYLYHSDVDGFFWNLLGVRDYIIDPKWIALIQTIFQSYYILIFLCFCGFIILRVFRRKEFLRISNFGTLPVIYFSIIYMIFFGGPRFHYPVMPWIAIYAGYFFHSLTNGCEINN